MKQQHTIKTVVSKQMYRGKQRPCAVICLETDDGEPLPGVRNGTTIELAGVWDDHCSPEAQASIEARAPLFRRKDGL